MVPQTDALPAFAFEATRCFGQDPMLLSYRNGLARPASRFIKAAIDVTVASLMLVVSSPLFLILGVVSRLDGGPTLFAHRRVGAGGRPFYCLKFRTMVVDADRVLVGALTRDAALAAEWAASRKLVNDPRVTRIGRFLRKTSLDELPQLINVLRLEMSLVGPRPIVDSEVPLYGEAIAQYYATRPGITGLWQVSGRSNTSYARRVQLDVWYVNNWTVWNDITVLLKTIPAVLGRHGAR
jgi:Undecaprenyl-phosphate galactose phosphotransferase WbaP